MSLLCIQDQFLWFIGTLTASQLVLIEVQQIIKHLILSYLIPVSPKGEIIKVMCNYY